MAEQSTEQGEGEPTVARPAVDLRQPSMQVPMRRSGQDDLPLPPPQPEPFDNITNNNDALVEHNIDAHNVAQIAVLPANPQPPQPLARGPAPDAPDVAVLPPNNINNNNVIDNPPVVPPPVVAVPPKKAPLPLPRLLWGDFLSHFFELDFTAKCVPPPSLPSPLHPFMVAHFASILDRQYALMYRHLVG